MGEAKNYKDFSDKLNVDVNFFPTRLLVRKPHITSYQSLIVTNCKQTH